jgi:hypothetical protein
MCVIIILSVIISVTVPVTSLLCRYRVKHHHSVSYGTMVMSAVIVALIWLACAFPIAFSYNSHHDAQHKWDPDWFTALLKLSAFIAVICLLPALAVVSYYQRRYVNHPSTD